MYDTDNRMVAAPGGTPGVTETYDYAPDNRRVVRKRPGTNWVTEVTLWVGSLRVASRTIVGPWASVNDTDYVTFAGRRFLVPPSGSPSAEGSDRLGSTAEHKPYGENAPGRFATYWRDSDTTGLDYADQRYYQPGAGRFVTADPYLASGGTLSPASWNRYAYVEGDPVNWIDPRGLAMIDPLHNSLMAIPDTTTGAGGVIWSPEIVPTGFDMLPGTTIPGSVLDLVWSGGAIPSSQVLPVVIGGVAIGSSSGVTVGSVISGLAAILGGIGIGEWIHQRQRSQDGQQRDERFGPRSQASLKWG